MMDEQVSSYSNKKEKRLFNITTGFMQIPQFLAGISGSEFRITATIVDVTHRTTWN
jgi:hypothetical protein